MVSSVVKRCTPIAVIMLTFCMGCSPEATSPTSDGRPYVITQEQLDAATTLRLPQAYDIVGDPFKGFPNDTLTTRHKCRSLFCDRDHTAPIVTGSVWVRRAYHYDDGVIGDLIDDVVMVKQDPGYYPEGGDYEYIKMPHDPSVDYVAHPNGMLPAIGDSLRGKGISLQNCVTCHANAPSGNNFLFTK